MSSRARTRTFPAFTALTLLTVLLAAVGIVYFTMTDPHGDDWDTRDEAADAVRMQAFEHAGELLEAERYADFAEFWRTLSQGHDFVPMKPLDVYVRRLVSGRPVDVAEYLRIADMFLADDRPLVQNNGLYMLLYMDEDPDRIMHHALRLLRAPKGKATEHERMSVVSTCYVVFGIVSGGLFDWSTVDMTDYYGRTVKRQAEQVEAWWRANEHERPLFKDRLRRWRIKSVEEEHQLTVRLTFEWIAEDDPDNRAREAIVNDPRILRATNGMGDTPLHMACMHGHLELAQWLIAQGADPYAEMILGRTPLREAEINKHHQLAAWLRDYMRQHPPKQPPKKPEASPSSDPAP